MIWKIDGRTLVRISKIILNLLGLAQALVSLFGWNKPSLLVGSISWRVGEPRLRWSYVLQILQLLDVLEMVKTIWNWVVFWSCKVLVLDSIFRLRIYFIQFSLTLLQGILSWGRWDGDLFIRVIFYLWHINWRWWNNSQVCLARWCYLHSLIDYKLITYGFLMNEFRIFIFHILNLKKLQ